MIMICLCLYSVQIYSNMLKQTKFLIVFSLNMLNVITFHLNNPFFMSIFAHIYVYYILSE